MTAENQRTRTIVAALKEVALFRGLPEAELEVLAGQVVRKHYGRNEVIFPQGARGEGLYIVVQGHVSISRQSPEGDELILALCEPGEYFGELALFDQAPRSASAVAMDDCRVLFLSRSVFRGFLQAHPAAVWTCLEVLVGQLRRLTEVADEMALLDGRRRLARCLLRLAEQGVVGTERERQAGRAVRITQQHLANMTGATRERVNKHLNAFVDEGLITLERGQVCIVDRARLQACAEGLA
jgi:CRP-like cAMP-binding protein